MDCVLFFLNSKRQSWQWNANLEFLSVRNQDGGNNVYVVVKPWKHDVVVHIWKFDNENRKHFPTKRGIAVNLKQWVDILCRHKNDTDETVEVLKKGKE